jgi:hypothetical protein
MMTAALPTWVFKHDVLYTLRNVPAACRTMMGYTSRHGMYAG